MPRIDTEPTPAAWLSERLPRRFDEYASDPNIGPWYHTHDLLADSAALLRTWHTRLVADDRTTAAAAATYLAGWLGGGLAGAVGQALVTVVGRDAISHIVVERLVEVLTPVIDACHDLGRTGRTGLWNEVADGLGLSVAHHPDIPAHSDVIDTLVRAVRTPGVPWRATPTLRIVDSAGGPVYVGQKGGCCLAYTCAGPPGEPRYWTTCKFRAPADSEQRQLFWIERLTAS